jgi:hypothetical protein
MTNRLTLASGSTFSIGAGSSATTVFGTDGVQNLTIAAGATVTLDASFNRGGDTITLTGNAASYTVTKSGSSVILTDATGSITIPVGVTGMNIAFADAAARSLVSTTTGAFTLGTQSVTETAAALTAGSSAIVGQTFTLTTGVETLTGTAGNDTFTAAATNATTGLAATTINNGDTIVGGAGTDTLNITSTATDNIALTGLTVSGVEVVTFTAANNLATVVPVAAAAVAGTRQVQVLDIGNLSLEAEQQTVDFGGLVKSGAASTYSLTVAGATITTASIAASASAATIATAVASAITSAAGASGTLNGIVASASAASGVVTVNFAPASGDVAAIVAPTTGLLTGTPVVTETRTSSAEVQSFTVTAAASITDTVTLANIGSSGTVVYTAAATDATASATATGIAGAINAAIATTSNTSADRLVRAEAVGATVQLVYKVAVGDAAIATATASTGAGDTAAVGAVTETRKGGEVDVTLSVNGAQYTVPVVIDPAILTATASSSPTLAAVLASNQNAARTAINTQLATVLGDAVTVGTSDEAGEILLTSKVLGTALPTITAVVRDSTTNLIGIDPDTAVTVANAVRTGATLQAQQVQYTFGGTVEATDGVNLYINGTNFGPVIGGGTSAASIATAVAAAINAALGAGFAVATGGVVTITAPVAGTPLPIISLLEIDGSTATMTLTRAESRDNVAALGTTTSTTVAASIAATSFADATDITLIGPSSAAASVTLVAATQTVGFRSVTSMTNTVGFASTVTNAALKSEGSSGTLTVTGAGLTSASLTGTTAGSATTTLSLVEGAATSTTIDAIRTLNVNTSGATVLNTDGLTALTAVNQTGAGALTLNATGTGATKVASVTTAGGADNIRITTATAVDVVTTTIDETINASVLTGAGNDRVIVETSGAGRTTVDTGDGNDTLVLTSISTGANSLSGGAGNDVFRINAISTLGTTSINGGDGTDVLRTTNTTFSLADYVTITANVSSIETLQLAAAATLDASQLAMTRFEFLAAGTNTVTEVQSVDRLVAVHTPAALASFGIPEVGTRVAPSNITASSLGYLVDSNPTLAGEQTTFGENLDITMTHVAENATVVALGNALTLTVGALGIVVGGTATTPTDVAELNSQVTVTGDIQTLNATLTSARGSGTRSDAPATTGLGNEAIAKLVVGTPTIDNPATTGAGADEGSLDNLTSIVVSGSGEVTINAGQIAALVAKLTTINLSGMTAFTDVNALGQEVSSGGTAGGFNNLSTSSVTLNNNVAETVILGGARDTVITGSVLGAVDTITGFTLVASALNPLLADTDRSDKLDLGTTTDGGTEFSGAAGGNAAKMVVTGSSLEAAVLQAASLKAANGTTNVQNVVFHFGGDTYVFQDKATGGTSVEGLDTGDFLVRLTGLQNLDLLVGGSVLGG